MVQLAQEWTALKCRTLGASYMCSVLFLPLQSLLTCFRSSLTCFADFVSLLSSSDSKAFLCLNAFSGSPTVVHRAFLFRLQCEGMATVTNWPLYMQYGITLWAYLSQTHRPNLRYYTVGIPSEPLVKDSHNRLSSTEKTQYCLLQFTWSHIYRYVCYGGIHTFGESV